MPHLAAFLLVACLIVITPGPDMAMVTKNALDGGRRAALLTALGTVTGLLVWMAASAAGIVAVLRTSAVIFTVVKLCGATAADDFRLDGSQASDRPVRSS